MKLWQILLVLGLGVACGFLEPGRFTYAFGHAALYVLLPALLYEAAWNLNLRVMKRFWQAIAGLTILGVVVTAAVVACALLAIGVPWEPAMLAGAILSATDPIAVVAVFRRLPVPRSLSTIVESESLLNDAVAVALYRAVLLVMTAGALSLQSAAAVALQTVGGVAGGITLGIAVAWLAARVLRTVNGSRFQIVATIASAYGAYFVADRLGLSGIFATIACGIALRYFERAWISLTIAADVERFWDVGATFANIVLFFLVGAALLVTRVTQAPMFALASIAGVVASRMLVGVPFSFAGWPQGWAGVVRIGGLRGGLCLALALALPSEIPYREAIVDSTLAVCLASLTIAALVAAPVVRRAAVRRT